MKNLLIAFLCIACAQSDGQHFDGQDFDQSKMDAFLAHIEQNSQGMASLSIFHNGKEVYQHTIGYAELEKKVNADSLTKYRIGSISKTFTATMIMQLVKEGKLSLDATLNKYFPQIGNAEKITIGHLLRHRSGIFNITSAEDYKSWEQTPMNRAALLEKIRQNGNVFAPGEKAEYSNSNYILLAFIAEDIEGRSYPEILQDRICKPCALTHTYYGSAISVARNEARSYRKGAGKEWDLASETDMSIPSGAGALVSTPTDLNKFMTCLFQGALTQTVSLKTMMELDDGFGIGMYVAPFYEKKAYGHNGGIDGFQSNAFYFPEEKVSVAYTSNAVSMAVNNVLIGVLSIYFGRDYEFPVFTEALTLKPEDLDQYLGVYASPSFPLKITISKKDNTLIGQATGQPSFRLEAYEKDKFRFDAAGLTMEFLPGEKKMIFSQGGRKLDMTRE